MGGQPNLPWYACWVPRDAWMLTGYVADISHQCTAPGCKRKHERKLINGAMLTALPLKVQLMSEPGRQVERRTLTAAEALAHAQAAIGNSGVKPAGRSPMWDGKPFELPREAVALWTSRHSRRSTRAGRAAGRSAPTSSRRPETRAAWWPMSCSPSREALRRSPPGSR
jgi:hypothetical protein